MFSMETVLLVSQYNAIDAQWIVKGMSKAKN
jgi:hypothetical protein